MKLIGKCSKSDPIPVTMLKDFLIMQLRGAVLMAIGRSYMHRRKAPVLFLKNWIIQRLCFRGFVFLTWVKSLISASLCSAHVGKQISQCCFLSAFVCGRRVNLSDPFHPRHFSQHWASPLSISLDEFRELRIVIGMKNSSCRKKIRVVFFCLKPAWADAFKCYNGDLMGRGYESLFQKQR